MEIPNTYMVLPYLTGGGASFNTNLTSGLSIVEWSMSLDNLNGSGTFYIFGHNIQNSYGKDEFYVSIDRSSGALYACSNGETVGPYTISLNTIYNCSFSAEKFCINDTVFPFTTPSTKDTTDGNMDSLFTLYHQKNSNTWEGKGYAGALIKIYSFVIKRKTSIGSTDSTVVRDFVPCLRISDSKIGLYDKQNNNFSIASNATTFNISPAINAKSFCNYVVSLCKYFNGTALSSDNQTQLYNYLVEGINPQQLINIRTALAILNKINSVAGNAQTITLSNGSLNNALSLNTAKQLVSRAFPQAYRSKFCRINQLYTSADENLHEYNYMYWCLYMVASTSFGSRDLTGYLFGGGSGGAGAYAGDGDKNASYTVTQGAGAKGGNSTIKLNDTVQATAYGANSGGVYTSGKVGGNPTVQCAGMPGESSTSTFIAVTIPPKSKLEIIPGYGGGGGGGCAVSAGGSTGTKTFTGGSANGANGGNGVGAPNEWAGDDDTFGGGGGGGASSGSGGTSQYNGPWRSNQVNATQNGLSSSNGKGGLGGCTNKGNNGANSDRLGAGGNPGAVYFVTDTSAVANGGNGGNSGGLKIATSTCTAASALFIFKQ